ncbi:MAG TPA: M36 family metallopeptidase [Thermoanaerobaculia bacterium]|jgi:hypothetical protein|nr:M36 family metallopeptidase [Thermoanaerobaculia bacterium]
MRRRLVVCIVSGFLIAVTIPASAVMVFTPFRTRFGSDWRVVVENGNLTALIGQSTTRLEDPSLGSDATKQIAQAFGATRLGFPKARVSAGIRHVTYHQVVEGQPIENVTVTLTIDPLGRLVGAVGNARALPDRPEPKLLSEDVLKDALVSSAFSDLVKRGPATAEIMGFVLFAQDDRVIPAYKVLVRNAAGFPEAIVIIDASMAGSSLQFLTVISLVKNSGAKHYGCVFLPNPMVSLRDRKMHFSRVPTKEPNPYFAVELHNLYAPASSSEPFRLSGPWVCVIDFEHQSPHDAPEVLSSTGDFMFFRGTHELPSVMVYYYVDEMQTHVRKLGFENLAAYSIQADVRLTISDKNAQFRHMENGIGRLEFGFRDLYVAEDADVIAHEYGHALQASSAGINYSDHAEANAMSEGFADYWALSFLEKLNRRYCNTGRCYGEWMRHDRCERDIDLGATLKNFKPNGLAHYNGEVWTAALWAIQRRLGVEVTQKLVLDSHAHVPYGPTFCQGAASLLSADAEHFQGRHARTIKRVLKRRRILTPGCTTSQLSQLAN